MTEEPKKRKTATPQPEPKPSEELAALLGIIEVLSPLDEGDRERILEATIAFFGLTRLRNDD